MQGFYNMVLRVNATTRSYDLKIIGDDTLRQTMGGKGLATHLLLEHNPAGVDPLGPDNHLIFTTGPVAGTGVWGSCRYGVFTKSPLTGFFSESYSGGAAAEHMAATGFDAVMIHGACDSPVWLEVTDQTVRFHDASDLWGLDTYETEERIKAWIKQNRPQAAKGCAALVIGPAGENQVRFALIENELWRCAGRTGVGAVMGSKKIKAVAFWGERVKELADADLIKAFAKEQAAIGKEDKGAQAYKNLGTPMMVDIMSNVGSFPTRYWAKGTCEHRESINAAALHSRCEVTPHACKKCFIACGRMAVVKEGRHKGLKLEGPEYETIYSFGGLCEIDSIEEVVYLNDLCDRLGIDTITAGNLAGLAIEAARQKRIDLDIDYGQTDKIAALLSDMAYRRGVGAVLAEGIVTAAKTWGMEDQAVHVKGLEPAGYDPRVLKGMALAYGTSDRGACHLRSTFYKPELAGMVDRDMIEGKASVFVQWEDRLTFFDTLILCRFYRDLDQWDQLATIVRGVTGLDLNTEQMAAIARSVTDETRRFNLREGMTMADDRLPVRFTENALPESGSTISADQVDVMLKEYYQARGWDEMGRPPLPRS